MILSNYNLLLKLDTEIMMSQTKRVQAALNTNQINYSGLGKGMSHFLRSGRGKALKEIPRLLISDQNGVTSLSISEIPVHVFNKQKEIVKEDPNAGTLSIQDFLGPELMETLRMFLMWK